MSNSQIKTALEMIASAQEELGCEFDLRLFRKLVELNAANPGSNNKETQLIIEKLIEGDGLS